MLGHVARTQAVYYRGSNGREPVDEFIECLSSKRAAKIDEYVDEYLNGRSPAAPPPEFPISSQVDGELRELRVRFANVRYRVLYQRSGTSSCCSRDREEHRRDPAGRRRSGQAAHGGLHEPDGRGAARPAAGGWSGRAAIEPMIDLNDLSKLIR